MKKNVQIGVLTGMLLVPGAVAHANEAENTISNETSIPYNVVAASTVIDLLKNFRAANEEDSSALTIANERIKYGSLNDADKGLLGKELLKLIDAKITYLEKYQMYKTEADSLKAAIGKLTNINTNIIQDTEAAYVVYEQLHMDFTASLKAISDAAGATSYDVTDFLSTLHYYDGADVFINAKVTRANIDKLENKIEEIELIKAFLTEFIEPLLAARKANPVDKLAFETEVEEVRTAFDALDSSIKALIKVQIVENNINVENTIKNAETDLSKAATVDKLINELKDNPPTSSTTFRAKLTAIEKSYGALNEFQKSLVEAYADVTDYLDALKVMNDIDGLAKMEVNSVGFREKVPEVRTAYNGLSLNMQGLVSNAEKLVEMEAGIDKAILIETQINAITVDNATTETPAARAAYNALLATERKYVKKEDLDLLATWEKSTSSAATVIKQINDISTDASSDRDISNFITKTNTAIASYSKIDSKDPDNPSKDQQLVTNIARLTGLKPYMEIAAAIMALNSTKPTYATDLADAKTMLETKWESLAPTAGLTESDKTNLGAMKALLQTKLKNLTDENKAAADIDAQILALKDSVNLVELAEIRQKYNALSPDGKKQVKNIAQLTALESQYKSVLNVVGLIEKIDFGAKDFARKVNAANIAYEKLPTNLKQVVNNYSKLQEYIQIAQLMLDIDKMRSSAKDFREKLTTAQQTFQTLTAGVSLVDKPTNAKERLLKEYGPKLAAFQAIISAAENMVKKIDALSSKTGQAFMDELALLTAEYKKMDSTTKRSVTNAALLKALEKDYKASLKVFTLIEKLPANTDKTYTKKVIAAEKAYQKLSQKQKDNVYNYAAKLQPVLKIANLIDRIEKLKVGSKTYHTETAAIRTEYDALTPAEQALVHNYSKLTLAEDNMVSAEQVVALIKEAIPTAEDYIAKLTAARNAYDALDKSQQKLVTNYKDLTTRERSVKPVLTLDANILVLDPSNARTFISKYKSAEKAYEKLTQAERGLLLNSEKFTGELKTLFRVMDAINNIKASSKTFEIGRAHV